MEARRGGASSKRAQPAAGAIRRTSRSASARPSRLSTLPGPASSESAASARTVGRPAQSTRGPRQFAPPLSLRISTAGPRHGGGCRLSARRRSAGARSLDEGRESTGVGFLLGCALPVPRGAGVRAALFGALVRTLSCSLDAVVMGMAARTRGPRGATAGPGTRTLLAETGTREEDGWRDRTRKDCCCASAGVAKATSRSVKSARRDRSRMASDAPRTSGLRAQLFGKREAPEGRVYLILIGWPSQGRQRPVRWNIEDQCAGALCLVGAITPLPSGARRCTFAPGGRSSRG